MTGEKGTVRLCDPNDTITINVGGQLFTTRRSTLYRLPHSRLYLVLLNDAVASPNVRADSDCECDCDTPKPTPTPTPTTLKQQPMQTQTQTQMQMQPRQEQVGPGSNNSQYIFFDRDPEIFKFILDYYRTGELHLPHSLCGPFIRKELIFWGIPEEDIEPCCLSLYMKYEEERKTKNMLFRDCFEDIEPMKHLVHISRGFKRWRYKSWLFLDFPTSSLGAKVWAVVLLVLMAVSIITYSLATHPDFRVERRFFSASQMNSSPEDAVARIPKQCRAFFNLSAKEKRDDKDYRYDCTIPLPGLIILDIVLNGVFTLEVLVKTLISPDRVRYLRSPTTILEICISLSFWLQMLLTHVTTGHQAADADGTLFLSIRTVIKINDAADSEENSAIQLLLAGCNMAQALRVFRIVKLSKISSGLRVLMLTVKKSITELVLLGFLLINGMFLFACLIYLAEYNVKDTFPSIPNALWWAIITITGVGYGDVFPKGGLGYFVGALCAISGCTVTGLAIPIIGHNFNTYYKYMRNYLKESKYLRELRKERGAFDVDVQDRAQLSIMKRKLSRGRGPNSCCSPADRSALLARLNSTIATLPLDGEVRGVGASNTAKCTPSAASAARKQPRPLVRSHTSLALTDNCHGTRHEVVCTVDHQPVATCATSKSECDGDHWNVEPLRTPKHRVLDENDHTVEETDCIRLNCQRANETSTSNNVSCVDDADPEAPILYLEKHKTLRKLMGNSFDRGIKRPVT